MASLENSSDSAFAPILRRPRGVSSKRLPLRSSEAGVLQRLRQLGEPVEAAGGVVAEHLADPLQVDVGERTRVRRRPQEVLQLVEVAQLVHHLCGIAEAERIPPLKS